MNILVTGGAGYIGSHTCLALASAGHKVIVYDNLSSGHKDALQWGSFEHGDVRDTQNVRRVLRQQKIEGVIHFAACIEVGESVLNPGKYYETIIGGSLSLLQAMRDEGIGALVASGTCAVYGQVNKVPITEDFPKLPINPYGRAKWVMEQMMQDFGSAHGLHWAALRYFNAAGADSEARIGERHRPETHLIPNTLKAACGLGAPLQLFGDDYATPDGTCIRDYIHVSDLAKAHVAAIEALHRDKETLVCNLGTGNGISVREIIESVERVTGMKVPYSMAPRRAGDSPKLTADSSHAFNELGWKPENSSVDMIIDTAWKWMQKDKANQAG